MPQRFPVAVGNFGFREWTLKLAFEFAHRVEDGSIVLWRPGLTFWIDVFGNQLHEVIGARLDRILADASPERTNERTFHELDYVRVTYEVDERAADPTTPHYRSLTGFVIADGGHVRITAYCDDPTTLGFAYAVIGSVRRAS